MLKIAGLIVVALLVAVAAIAAYAATKPDTFRIQRSLAVNAPPEKIFALINDFRRWTAWSPYEHRDPQLKRTYGASTSGKGATYAWEGNKDVGEGRMEIIEASAPNKLVIALEFIKPFKAQNTAEFTVAPKGAANEAAGAEVTWAEVTWAMYGPNQFVGKVMSVFIDIDKMVGKDFEAGLANLKKAAEQ